MSEQAFTFLVIILTVILNIGGQIIYNALKSKSPSNGNGKKVDDAIFKNKVDDLSREMSELKHEVLNLRKDVDRDIHESEKSYSKLETKFASLETLFCNKIAKLEAIISIMLSKSAKESLENEI